MKLLLWRSNHHQWRSGYRILTSQLFSSSSLPPLDTLYSRISRTGQPSISVIPVIEKWLEEGKAIKQTELQKFIKQLRKYRRYGHALQISEWMTDQGSYQLSPGDVAIRIDLISKVHGVEKAEEYFDSIPDTSRTLQVYGSLLNCYAHSKNLEKAEAIFQKMKELRFLKTSLSYNVMLSLYSRIGKYEKLDPLMKEMQENGVSCDMYSYNIRLNAYVISSDIDEMEKLLMKMEVDPEITMDFHAYVVAANGYLKAGLIDKALTMLKRSEQLVNGSNRRFAYEVLITLHTAARNKADVYRIWNKLKNIGRFLNSSYLHMISSLVKLDDIDGAEKIWEEWNSGKVLFDIRIPNLMINAYSKKGAFDKAESFINKIIESGNKPDGASWNYLAVGYNERDQMEKAVETMRKAISASKLGWKPSLPTLSSCIWYLKRQGDVKSAEELLKLAKEHCQFSAGAYDKIYSYYVDNKNLADQEEDTDQNFVEEPPTTLELADK
ncbi:pentatricopeptide repeat-containing protein At2g20710, mitochondrial-like [Mercurialis annua]|uniref:pentatricopeptide repeat-containing protein At2g20710, mitochondrial-like n=1 Tax=Mercurialis annua TaxID=3986 RepID=UPI00216104C3|nr:pentatricopeptide repeat-containing protein At2g20710, mitochondrial-like [Mercurialis annua]